MRHVLFLLQRAVESGSVLQLPRNLITVRLHLAQATPRSSESWLGDEQFNPFNQHLHPNDIYEINFYVQQTYSVSIIPTNWLILLMEIIAVYYEKQQKYINTVFGQNAELFNGTACGAYSSHCDLNGGGTNGLRKS
jgi:hypothetical protein